MGLANDLGGCYTRDHTANRFAPDWGEFLREGLWRVPTLLL